MGRENSGTKYRSNTDSTAVMVLIIIMVTMFAFGFAGGWASQGLTTTNWVTKATEEALLEEQRRHFDTKSALVRCKHHGYTGE